MDMNLKRQVATQLNLMLMEPASLVVFMYVVICSTWLWSYYIFSLAIKLSEIFTLIL